MALYNPFARRESHSAQALIAYRALAVASWALVVIFGIFYSIRGPADTSRGRTIWHQLGRSYTEFTVDVVVVEIYWILLLLSQIFYLGQLFNKEEAAVISAAEGAPYFILQNLFVFAWIHLWVRNYFWPAEVFLVASFINQHVLFWRVRSLPPVSHLAVVAGPHAWTLIALFWNGAIAVHAHTTAAEITANVFIWIFFLIGTAHILSRADAILGYSLSLLAFGLAVTQTSRKHGTHLQWIFAWVIFACFLLQSLYVTQIKHLNRDIWFRSLEEQDSSDAERAPLLDDSAPAPGVTA
ncbi:hypothetical protein BDV18DRAFT_143572 [Aspergillus unguis]